MAIGVQRGTPIVSADAGPVETKVASNLNQPTQTLTDKMSSRIGDDCHARPELACPEPVERVERVEWVVGLPAMTANGGLSFTCYRPLLGVHKNLADD